MKTKNILVILSLGLLLACSSAGNRAFVTGTFVNSSVGAYSVADDTLFIEVEQGDRFRIHRRTGFNLIRNGIKGKREHETEIWDAVYDERTGVMTETRKGKMLVFHPDSAKLMIGSRSYQKTN
ncbi:MAG: hypothetical protein EOO09_21475 [Chitinophagaceae bacterium]|nr:MAG: hypothetical protein EOO09_21475 [Chitinophagaceae bacterium]